MNESLTAQREYARQQAQYAFDAAMIMVKEEGTPEFRPQNLTQLAQAAAAEGLWEHFAAQLGPQEAEALIVTDSPPEMYAWGTAFAIAGNTARMRDCLRGIKDIQLYEYVAGFAANAGAIKTPSEIAQTVFANDPETRSHLATAVAAAQAERGNWTAVDNIDWGQIMPLDYLNMSRHAAMNDDIPRARDYISAAIAELDTPETDVHTLDIASETLHEALAEIIRSAFNQDDLHTLLDIACGFPASSLLDPDEITGLLRHQELHIMNETGQYARGLQLVIAHARESPITDHEAYNHLESAVRIGDWDAIELLRSRLNLETLSLLANLAHQEGKTEVFENLQGTILRLSDQDSGNVINTKTPLSLDAAPVMLSAASKGDWPAALRIFEKLSLLFIEENVADLTDIAIAQENYDALLMVVAHGQANQVEHATCSALATLEARGEIDATYELEYQLRNKYSIFVTNLIESSHRLAKRAQIAASLGNWKRALGTLHRLQIDLETMPREAESRPAAFKYASAPGEVALEALKVIAAAERSKIMNSEAT